MFQKDLSNEWTYLKNPNNPTVETQINNPISPPQILTLYTPLRAGQTVPETTQLPWRKFQLQDMEKWDRLTVGGGREEGGGIGEGKVVWW